MLHFDFTAVFFVHRCVTLQISIITQFHSTVASVQCTGCSKKITRFISVIPISSPAATAAYDFDRQTVCCKWFSVVMNLQRICINNQLLFILNDLEFRYREITVQYGLCCTILEYTFAVVFQTYQCRCQHRDSITVSLNNRFFFAYRMCFQLILFHSHVCKNLL